MIIRIKIILNKESETTIFPGSNNRYFVIVIAKKVETIREITNCFPLCRVINNITANITTIIIMSVNI